MQPILNTKTRVSFLNYKSDLVCIKPSQRLLNTLRIKSKLSSIIDKAQLAVAFSFLLKSISYWYSPNSPHSSHNEYFLVPTPSHLFQSQGLPLLWDICLSSFRYSFSSSRSQLRYHLLKGSFLMPSLKEFTSSHVHAHHPILFPSQD